MLAFALCYLVLIHKCGSPVPIFVLFFFLFFIFFLIVFLLCCVRSCLTLYFYLADTFGRCLLQSAILFVTVILMGCMLVISILMAVGICFTFLPLISFAPLFDA